MHEYTYVHAQASHCGHIEVRGQLLEARVLSPTTWVPRIELWLSGLAAGTFTH